MCDIYNYDTQMQGSPQLFQASMVVVERSSKIVDFLIKNNHIKKYTGTPGWYSTALTCFRENPEMYVLYLLEYKPGLLFPSWLWRPGVKTRLAFIRDWRL